MPFVQPQNYKDLKTAGIRVRMQHLERVAAEFATVDVTDADSFVASETDADWFEDAPVRQTLAAPVLSDTRIDWITQQLAASGTGIDVDTFSLKSGRYKITLNGTFNPAVGTLVQGRFALTDDGPANDGADGAAVSLWDNGTDHVLAIADVTQSASFSRSFAIDLPLSTAGIDQDDGGAVDVAGEHLLYLCAAAFGAGTADWVLSGVSSIVVERLA